MCRYEKDFQLRKPMRAWLKISTTAIKQECKRRIQVAIADTEKACRAEASSEQASLRQQLAEAQYNLKVEKQGKELLAQDMKRSFMRGVCALNMEAMQVAHHVLLSVLLF